MVYLNITNTMYYLHLIYDYRESLDDVFKFMKTLEYANIFQFYKEIKNKTKIR